jgi:hypothetical protein
VFAILICLESFVSSLMIKKAEGKGSLLCWLCPTMIIVPRSHRTTFPRHQPINADCLRRLCGFLRCAAGQSAPRTGQLGLSSVGSDNWVCATMNVTGMWGNSLAGIGGIGSAVCTPAKETFVLFPPSSYSITSVRRELRRKGFRGAVFVISHVSARVRDIKLVRKLN